jgi:hypothetical protein
MKIIKEIEMREIKFRVWDILNKKMLKWGVIFNLPAWEIFPGTPEQRAFEVMQYSGVHDESEDEIEIYEGDKIKFNYEGEQYIGEVKFEAGTFIIACEELADSYISFLEIADSDRDYWWIDGEVIGNIHEK